MAGSKTIASADAGDFHFELKKEGDKYHCLRSDVSNPTQAEEVTDLQDIPQTVFTIFNKLMY